MTVYAIIFYLLALLILGSTAMAITRRNLIHAVIYLIFSFFGSAMLFYLFGAPFLAIYAGAIMVLFLFIVIMLKLKTAEERLFPPSQWLPAALIGLVYIGIGAGLVISEPGSRVSLKTAKADPGLFGLYIFEKHWLSIEIVSLLLLVALIGALVLGLRSKKARAAKAAEGEL